MRILIILSLALFPVSPLAIAQDQKAEDSDETVEDVDFDEITVMGTRSLGSLRTELVKAEDEVYDLYNVFNDDDDYDIICKRETRIGSQIPRRVCQARLFREAASEAAQEVVDGEILTGPAVNKSKHNKILREKMRTLAIEHPELLTALRHRLEVEKKFKAERGKKFD